MSEEKKKGGGAKTLLILLVILLVIPGLALFGVYKLNDQFRLAANRILAMAPGPVGTYFDSFPTQEESQEQMRQIAEYILDIDVNRAVDKLTILESEDPAAYDNIVKLMLRINPNATKNILEEIRSSNIKKDVVLSTLETINEEKGQEVTDQATYLSDLSLPTAIEEMAYIISGSINGHKELASILDAMDVIQAAKLMEQLDKDDYNQIMGLLPGNKGSLIRAEIANVKVRANELENISDIYQTEDVAKLVDYIGNENTYSMSELAQIYKNLGVVKAGKVLAKLNNDAFVYKLIGTIKEKEILENNEDKITQDMLKSLKIYKEFDDNVIELSNVYAKMSNDKVAEIIKKMIRNSSAPREYDLLNGDQIVITDEELALAIMDNFTQKKIGEILSYLDDTLSSEISRKITLPQL
jgi:flagellar motility protein MotE (MotC chaperone)